MLTRIALIFTILLILNRNPLTYILHEYSVVLGGIGMIICAAFLFIDFSVSSKKIDKENLKLNIFDWLLLIFLIYMLGRSLFTIEIDRSLVGLILYLGFVPAYFVARTMKISVKEIYYVILGSFGYLTLFGYLQWIFAIPFGEMQMATSPSFSRFYPMRITSTLGSSLHFGIIYTLVLTLLNSRILFLDKITKKNIFFVTLLNLIAIPLIIGSYSRGAMILYLLCWVLLFLSLPKKKLLFLTFCILSFLFFTIYYLSSPQYFKSIANRFLSILNLSDLSNIRRILRYKTIIGFLIDNPLWIIYGVGPGYTGNIVKLFGMDSIFNIFGIKSIFGEELYTTENYPLKVLLEVGIIGFLLFCLLFFIAMKKSLNLYKKFVDPHKKWLFLGIFPVFLGVFFHSLTLQSFEIPGISLLVWFFIGFISRQSIKYNERFI